MRVQHMYVRKKRTSFDDPLLLPVATKIRARNSGWATFSPRELQKCLQRLIDVETCRRSKTRYSGKEGTPSVLPPAGAFSPLPPAFDVALTLAPMSNCLQRAIYEQSVVTDAAGTTNHEKLSLLLIRYTISRLFRSQRELRNSRRGPPVEPSRTLADSAGMTSKWKKWLLEVLCQRC